MKKLFIVFAAFVFLSSFAVFSGIGEVISGIKAGNAATLAKYFDNNVEISLLGKTNNYSKDQGEAVLRDFFTSHPVKSFSVIHRGESGDSEFFIGKLVTANGTFRTTVNLKQKGEKQILREIKFENQ